MYVINVIWQRIVKQPAMLLLFNYTAVRFYRRRQDIQWVKIVPGYNFSSLYLL